MGSLSWRRVCLWWTAALVTTATLPPRAIAETHDGCDCRKIRLYWSPSGDAGSPALVAELDRRLRAEFDVEGDEPPAAGTASVLRVLALNDDAYWALRRDETNSDLELLNARMLAVPLYVFVRRAPPADRSQWQIAVAAPKEYRLANLGRLREVLAPRLGTEHVVITELPHPALLAEELDAPQSRFDAVALFGEEPSDIFERFLDRYLALRQRVSSPPSPPSVLLWKAGPRVLVQSPSQIEHAPLASPADLFYRFGDSAGDDKVTTGLGRLPMLGPAARNGLPFLLSNVRRRVADGTLPACGAQKLRRILGDAALVGAHRLRTAKAPDAAQLALEHALLLDAYLATRTTTKNKGGDEIVRGLALAAHLTVHGDEAPARRAQDDVGARFDEGGRRLLAKLGLDVHADTRQSFSCDAVQLAAEARKEVASGGADLVQRLQHLRDRLVRALLSDPQPAAHKPGCGLTQVVDYDPYLDLAELGAIEHGRVAAIADGGAFRLAAVVTTVVE
jgi:hypothetical protein